MMLQYNVCGVINFATRDLYLQYMEFETNEICKNAKCLFENMCTLHWSISFHSYIHVNNTVVYCTGQVNTRRVREHEQLSAAAAECPSHPREPHSESWWFCPLQQTKPDLVESLYSECRQNPHTAYDMSSKGKTTVLLCTLNLL
jgi:hypothetical protein